MTDKLAELVSRCKGPVYVTVNNHKAFYESAKTAWENLCSLDEDLNKDTGAETVKKMIELDTIIEVHFYPDTPIGFYQVFHWDLESALALAIDALAENQKEQH